MTFSKLIFFLPDVANHELPVYVVLRRLSPVECTEIPPSLIDARRTAAGVMFVTTAFLESGVLPISYQSPEDILGFAKGRNTNKRNYFVQKEAEPKSCPAPEGTVKRVLETMISRPSRVSENSPADWARYLTEEDIDPSLEFGHSFFEFSSLLRSLDSMQAGDITKVQRVDSRLHRLQGQINAALGY